MILGRGRLRRGREGERERDGAHITCVPSSYRKQVLIRLLLSIHAFDPVDRYSTSCYVSTFDWVLCLTGVDVLRSVTV